MNSTAFRIVFAMLLFACVGTARSAEQVTVITSFPKELTAAYKKAFEAKHPGVTLEILNKGTSAGVAYVRETPAGQRPDVFWASAPDAFEVLAKEKLLQKAPEVDNPAVPAKIGAYPVNDPEGFYKGQALAGYGIMWNKRYLQAHKLPEPKEWRDLTKPAYFGHVAVSSPSRSGTTHLTVETILQGEGWGKGWEQLLRIAGNCAAVTERSFGVPDGVSNGQFGIGLVIDFFGLSSKYSGFPTEFVYPSVTAIVPANIGLIEGAKNPAGAKKFMQFTLSTAGQELLLEPKISRLPVLPSISLPPGFPNAFEIAKRAKVQFDSELSEARYYVVSSLFDQTITFRLKELQQATKAIHDAEARIASRPNTEAAKWLQQAKAAAYTPVLSAEQVANKEFLALFKKNKKDTEATKSLTALEEQWSTKAKENYDKAVQLAQRALAAAK